MKRIAVLLLALLTLALFSSTAMAKATWGGFLFEDGREFGQARAAQVRQNP